MNKKLYDDSWMHILLLTTLVILAESIKGYSFSIMNYKITYSILLLPLTYLIANYITKKYDFKKTLSAIGISIVGVFCFIFIMCFAIGKEFLFFDIAGDILGYGVSQIINLIFCSFLMHNTKPNVILIFSTYLISLIVFYMIYTLVYLDTLALDNYWIKYIVTMGIQCVICIPLSIIDRCIKIGR